MEPLVAEIYQLVKKKTKEQAAYDRNSYDIIVEETIDYFLQRGKLSEDENIEFIKNQLAEMFETVRDEAAEE
jgi:hypothetical protein